MSRKRIFTKPILEKIIEMVSEFEWIKTVSKGDLADLPSPDYFKELMPITYVSPGKISSSYVNNDPNIGLLNQIYNFDIIYVRYHDLENETFNWVLDNLIDEGEQIAEMFMERDTLDDIQITGGDILGSMVTEVDFDSNTYGLFKDLEVPASICTMHMEVYFRTKRMK